MKKFEVTVTPDYVSKWGIADAVREILQNAIDAEAHGFMMSWEYDEDAQELLVHSEGASLSTRSLLLGATTKASDSSAVGQFGEGYKIAALVLLRNEMSLTIDNGPCKEIWTARFVKSRRYGCDVLTFDVGSCGWSFNRSNTLTFRIGGMAPYLFEEIKYVWLGFQEQDTTMEVPIAESSIGAVYQRPGSVYVNGLFVCNHEPYKHSYNFKPGQLNLDRDRKLASSFDLEWLASKLWAATDAVDKIAELAAVGAADVKFITSHSSKSTVNDAAWRKFIDQYGSNAVPVTTQEELERLSKSGKYRPIFVGSNYYCMITSSDRYEEPEDEDKAPALSSRFREWLDGIADNIHVTDYNACNALIDELEKMEDEYL